MIWWREARRNIDVEHPFRTIINYYTGTAINEGGNQNQRKTLVDVVKNNSTGKSKIEKVYVVPFLSLNPIVLGEPVAKEWEEVPLASWESPGHAHPIFFGRGRANNKMDVIDLEKAEGVESKKKSISNNQSFSTFLLDLDLNNDQYLCVENLDKNTIKNELLRELYKVYNNFVLPDPIEKKEGKKMVFIDFNSLNALDIPEEEILRWVKNLFFEEGLEMDFSSEELCEDELINAYIYLLQYAKFIHRKWAIVDNDITNFDYDPEKFMQSPVSIGFQLPSEEKPTYTKRRYEGEVGYYIPNTSLLEVVNLRLMLSFGGGWFDLDVDREEKTSVTKKMKLWIDKNRNIQVLDYDISRDAGLFRKLKRVEASCNVILDESYSIQKGMDKYEAIFMEVLEYYGVSIEGNVVSGKTRSENKRNHKVESAILQQSYYGFSNWAADNALTPDKDEKIIMFHMFKKLLFILDVEFPQQQIKERLVFMGNKKTEEQVHPGKVNGILSKTNPTKEELSYLLGRIVGALVQKSHHKDVLTKKYIRASRVEEVLDVISYRAGIELDNISNRRRFQTLISYVDSHKNSFQGVHKLTPAMKFSYVAGFLEMLHSDEGGRDNEQS